MTAPQASVSHLAAALRYASLGWPVIPLHTPENGVCDCGKDCGRSNGKHPWFDGWGKRATTDEQAIRGWWRTWPNANVGLVTGARSGFFVFDVDTDKGGDDSLATLPPVPDTIEAKTGSGGRHYLFKHPGFYIKSSTEGLGRGLDIKGDGGQIVAAPSLHKSGRSYEWASGHAPDDCELASAPAWLLERLQPSIQEAAPKIITADNATRRAQAYIARMPQAISGSRGHDSLWAVAIALCRGFRLSASEAIALILSDYNPRCVPPWSEKEIAHKVRDAIEHGDVPFGYLLDAQPAQAAPRREPAAPSEPHEPGDSDGDDAPAYVPTAADNLAKTWHTFTEAELVTDPPPERYVARPRIPEGKTVVLSAAGGTGKTTLVVDFAYRRAVGEPFIDGTELKPGETIILTGEDGVTDFWRKLHALRLARSDFNAGAAAAKIHLLDVTGIAGVELVRTEFGQHVVTSMPETLGDVIKAKAPRADLVVVETISRFGGGPETNESHAQMVKAADRICRLTGASTLLVGHVSQAAGRAGIADQYAARGGTALIDNARSGLVMSPLTQENAAKYAPGSHLTDDEMERYVVLTHPKSMGPKAAPVLLERCWNDAGAYFRIANLKYRTQQSDAQLYAQLRVVVAKYMASGQDCTARKLRARYREFGLSENRMETFVDDAISAGVLRQIKDRTSRGGGVPLVLGSKEVPEDNDDD